MEEKLIQRLESAVARLESLSTSGLRQSGLPEAGDGAPVDPSILAFDDFLGQYMSRVTAAGEKFGGKALEVTKILEEAFGFLKELLIKVKQTQDDISKKCKDPTSYFNIPCNEIYWKMKGWSILKRGNFWPNKWLCCKKKFDL